jgi:hypothetical protein
MKEKEKVSSSTSQKRIEYSERLAALPRVFLRYDAKLQNSFIPRSEPHYPFYKALKEGYYVYRNDVLNHEQALIASEDLDAVGIARYGSNDLTIVNRKWREDYPSKPKESPGMIMYVDDVGNVPNGVFEGIPLSRIVPFETVDHPSHYTQNGVEAIEVIEAWNLDFHLGNVIKYIARWDKKDDPIHNLRKAIWYIERKIRLLEKESRPISSKKESPISSKG